MPAATPVPPTPGEVGADGGPGRDQRLAEHLLAVLREAFSDVARHARADAAMVEVAVTADELSLLVADNGTGLPDEPHGTRLEWVVPLAE